MRQGLKDRLITIERATTVQNDYGEEVPTWAMYAEVMAEVRFGAGQERREAAQEAATAPGTFRVLHNDLTASVTTKDRINFDGSAWDIQSNIPVGLNSEREITATRSA